VSALLVSLSIAGVLLLGLLTELVKGAVVDEAKTRLERLPLAVLRLARRRLAPEHRDAIYEDEWLPELEFIARETQGLPITRLVRATTYALGLLRSARAVSAALGDLRDPGGADPNDREHLSAPPDESPNWLRPVVDLINRQSGSDPSAAVIGITGPWGSGKTAAMSLLQKQFEADLASSMLTRPRRTGLLRRCRPFRRRWPAGQSRQTVADMPGAITAWFNPWYLSPDESVAAGVAAAMMKAAAPMLDRSEAPRHRRQRASAGHRAPTDRAEGRSDRTPEQVIGEVAAGLQRSGRTMVIFMDDLDRCLAETMFEALNVVRTVTGKPADEHFRFVLGFDPDALAGNLDEILTRLHGSGAAMVDPSRRGRLFLDKLVQVEVKVPHPTVEDCRRWVDAAGQREAVSDVPGDRQGLPEEVCGIMVERLIEQPNNTPRLACRFVHTWQLYRRRYDAMHTARDGNIHTAHLTQLVIAVELGVRWPVLVPHLDRRVHGRSGLQILAAAAADDHRWRDALSAVGLSHDDGEVVTAAGGLRNILVRYDGIMVADLVAALTDHE